MIKEAILSKNLGDLERYILGDLPKGKLPTQIIQVINSGEKIEIKIRRMLRWILTNKYSESKG